MISNVTNHSTLCLKATRSKATRRSVWLAGALTLLGASTLPAVASASPNFPVVLQEELDLGCVPQCTVCHTDNYGGYRTVTRPFGVTLQSPSTFAGSEFSTVVGREDDSLRDAIQYMAALEAGTIAGKQGIDSDGDGVDDIAELQQLRDPSVFGVGDMCGPRYGCGARVEPRSPMDLSSALALGFCALGLGAVARRHLRQRGQTAR